MKKILLKSILILLFLNACYSQTFQWVKHYTHTINISPAFFVFPSDADNSGHMFMGSIYNFKLDYNDMVWGDVIIHKYNNTGTEILSKILTGKAVIDNIETDEQGNFYVSGGFMDTLWIDSANYLLNIGSGLNINYFLIKLDSTGNFVWKKNISTTNFIYLETIKIKNGFLYAGIYFSSSQQAYIKKYDLNGNEIMNISENSVVNISSIDVDARGDIYVSGACNCCNLQFSNLTASSQFTYNEYYVKYNPDGSASWVRFVQDATFQRPNLVCDVVGNIYACGNLNGPFMFGNFQALGPQWVYDFFLTKIDSSGTFLWFREIPHSENITGDAGNGRLKSISIDPQNNIFFAGFQRGVLNWGNNIITTTAGGTDILVLKYNTNGNLLWGKTAGGTGDDRVDAISIDNQGNALISGNFYGTATFDSINAIGSGQINPFIALLNTSITGIHHISLAIPNKFILLQNYPNPFNPTTIINYQLPKNSFVKLVIYDVTGREVKTLINEKQNAGSYKVEFDGNNLSSGVYFYKLTADNFSETRKLVLMK